MSIIPEIQLNRAGDGQFNISKTDKMKVFWDIALTGTERGFNKMGNSTLLNPQSSIQAIHEMNIMSGHHEPDQTGKKLLLYEAVQNQGFENTLLNEQEFNQLNQRVLLPMASSRVLLK